MGWLVEHLLKNRIEIKNRSLDFSDDASTGCSHLELDDQYNDLILVEVAINKLYKKGVLSDFEIKVIDYLSDGKEMVNSKKNLGLGRQVIAKYFSAICQRVSHYLGGHFTDDGLISEVAETNSLTVGQVEAAKRYMTSRHKHLINRSKESNEIT